MLDATAHLEKLTWVQIIQETGMKRNKCIYQLTVKMQCTSFWLPKWDTERMGSGEQNLLVNVLCINNTKNNTQLAHIKKITQAYARTHTCMHTLTHTSLRPTTYFHHFIRLQSNTSTFTSLWLVPPEQNISLSIWAYC